MERVLCGKKLRVYLLNRQRPYDYGEIPLCGKTLGHRGNCISGEALERLKQKRRGKGLTAKTPASKLPDDEPDGNRLTDTVGNHGGFETSAQATG